MIGEIGEKARLKAKCRVMSPAIFQVKAIFAGFAISLGMMACNAVNMSGGGKVLSGVAFSIGLLLIIFLGGELFTGNAFVMTYGVLNGDVGIIHSLAVLFTSYIYNFVGCLAGSIIYVIAMDGVNNESELAKYYSKVMEAKLSIGGGRLFCLAILCNVFVCLAVMIGIVIENQVTNIALVIMCIASFITCGFEHCVANMAHFIVGAMCTSGVGSFASSKHMIIVTLGNIVGGAIFVALPVFCMNFKSNDSKTETEDFEDDENDDYEDDDSESDNKTSDELIPNNVELPKCVKKEW